MKHNKMALMNAYPELITLDSDAAAKEGSVFTQSNYLTAAISALVIVFTFIVISFVMPYFAQLAEYKNGISNLKDYPAKYDAAYTQASALYKEMRALDINYEEWNIAKIEQKANALKLALPQLEVDLMKEKRAEINSKIDAVAVDLENAKLANEPADKIFDLVEKLAKAEQTRANLDSLNARIDAVDRLNSDWFSVVNNIETKASSLERKATEARSFIGQATQAYNNRALVYGEKLKQFDAALAQVKELEPKFSIANSDLPVRAENLEAEAAMTALPDNFDLYDLRWWSDEFNVLTASLDKKIAFLSAERRSLIVSTERSERIERVALREGLQANRAERRVFRKNLIQALPLIKKVQQYKPELTLKKLKVPASIASLPKIVNSGKLEMVQRNTADIHTINIHIEKKIIASLTVFLKKKITEERNSK